MKITTTYEACSIIEGFDGGEQDQATILAAWQYIKDSGAYYALQGFYGRNVRHLTEAGLLK